MKLIEVKTPADIKLFHHAPREIYKNDSNWIPHITADIEKIFNPEKNKLFEKGKAIRWVMIDTKHNVTGRIGAFINHKTSFSFKQPTGGVGFFECVNNQQAADLLLNTAKKWLAKNGMEAMDGPINFGEKQEFWGLLVDNFTSPSSYMMNYNPEYYKSLFEDYGFKLYYYQYIFKRDLYVPAQPVFVRKYNQMNADPNYRISNVRKMSPETIATNFRSVYNGSWGGHDNFKEMPANIALKIVRALKPIMDPDIVVFVFHKNEPIAFYVNIPELNEIFKFVDGKLNWWNKLKVWYHLKRKTPKTMVGIVFGVIKEFQGKGIEVAMIKWSEDNIVSLNRYNETIMTWIGDFNPKMIKVCENLGAQKFRTLGTYRYLFDQEAEFERCPIVE